MAKKKNENSLQYLQMPLPSGSRYSKMTKVAFGGLNKRIEHDSGELTMEYNISTSEYPYLTPSESHIAEYQKYTASNITPISMSAFDNFVFVIYREDVDETEGTTTYIKLDYITKSGDVYTGLIKSVKTTDYDESEDEIARSIVQFNVYIQSIDIVNGEYEKRYLIFPDKVSLHTNIVDTKLSDWTSDDYKNASRSALYYDASINKYFTVYDKYKDEEAEDIVGSSEYEDDEGKKVTAVAKLNGGSGYFQLDGMSVDIKEYYNDKAKVDESGAVIYPPPDTSSHNGWYRNTYNQDIYRWCEYEMARQKEDEEISLEEVEEGEDTTEILVVSDGSDKFFKVFGFELDNNYHLIYDGEMTEGWKVSFAPTMPNIKYATVHLSRLFGVSDDCVYASGFNDYTNWNLDTIDEYNESNAWQSKAQSNTKADGNFTGIINFQGHVVCFKRDFMHEIYNTKNPFRIQDIYAEGAIDHRTLQDVDGKLIFVSEDDVKIYTGSNPRIIGYPLNMPRYEYAVSGTDNRNYYLYCESRGKSYLYVYDTYTELWSEQGVGSRVLSFAHNKNGMYMLCENGIVYQIDTEDYEHNWSFETDLVTNKSVDIKHIKKIQMLVEHPSESELQIYILYDDEEFDELATTSEIQNRCVYNTVVKGKCGKYPIRVKPRKTANYGFKLHIQGIGYAKIYGLEVFIEQGGDLYV